MQIKLLFLLIPLAILSGVCQGFSQGKDLKKRKERSVYVASNQSDLQDLYKAGRNVFIFHYISSCSSCKKFLPIFEKVAADSERFGFNVVFAKLDVMKIYKQVEQLQIKSYPSLQFFKYGKYLTSYTGEKQIQINYTNASYFHSILSIYRTYDNLFKFVKEASFPLKEIDTLQIFDDIYQNEGIFSVFIGKISSLDFQQYEFSSSTYGDMGHYYINTSNMDKLRLKEDILAKFNQFHIAIQRSLILLINVKSIQKYYLLETFEVPKIEEFYNKYAYSFLDNLDERNLNKLLIKSQDGLLFLSDLSIQCIDIQNLIIPQISYNSKQNLSIFVGNKGHLDNIVQKKLQNLLTLREFNQNKPQFYLIRKNGKQIYSMDITSSKNITVQDVQTFISSALDGKLPKFVESEPIPKNNQSPIRHYLFSLKTFKKYPQTIVGRTFEQEVYMTNHDVLVYFKSDFSKEHGPITKELNLIVKQIEENGVSDFIKIVSIDMSKNKVYSEKEDFLEDIEVVPKIYYFLADNQKHVGIKLQEKDSLQLLQTIKKIASFDWNKKVKRSDRELLELRMNIKNLTTNKNQDKKNSNILKMKDL